MYHPSMKAKMGALEARKTHLERMLEDRPEPPALRLHPSLGARFRSEIARLSEALQTPEAERGARSHQHLRGLVSEVRMIPKLGSPGGHDIELVGDLASILSMIEGDLKSSGQPLHSKKPRRCVGAADSFESVSVVAGVGFEPTTFRL